MEKGKTSIFNDFTCQFALSKTLRFELKPTPETLANMRFDFEYKEDIRTFLLDQRVEDAYQTLKPFIDKVHEEFISDSLGSKKAKEINFYEYVERRKDLIKYQRELKKILKNKEGSDNHIKEKRIKELERNTKNNEKTSDIEKEYRVAIGKLFIETADYWKNKKYKKYQWKIGSNVASGAGILKSQDILNLIVDTEKDNKIQNAIKEFKGFFTYFTGFNQNRQNYYETEKEKATAVASRIVHDNLPKFSDNAEIYEVHANEYADIYDVLVKLGRNLVNKDKEQLFPINNIIFADKYFNFCISQNEIEEYNREIGNANFLINLYNQAKNGETGFKKLPKFKTLYKQIGCGKNKSFFFALTHESETEAKAVLDSNPDKKVFSVEKIIGLAKSTGEIYLNQVSRNGQIETLPDFIGQIKDRESYEGVYWSKAALNTISSRYFADWSTLKKKLKFAKVFGKPDKGSDEDAKIPAAIELDQLFLVLDDIQDESWKEPGTFFKKNLTNEEVDAAKKRKNKIRQEIIEQALKPSSALLNLVLSDIEEHSQFFIKDIEKVEKATQEYFSATEKNREEKRRLWKETIKAWIDHVCDAYAMLKYFLVREDKSTLDSDVANGLKRILFESKMKTDILSGGIDDIVNWFEWRDALRNFLTKKPQDDLKENKLKLNFNCPYLLGGWSPIYGTYDSILLENGGRYYLVIINGSALSDEQVRKIETNCTDNNLSKRFVIHTQKIDNKNPPRWFIRSKGESFAPLVREGKLKLTDEILHIYDNDLFSKTKNKEGYREPLKKLIDYFKEGFRIHPDFNLFDFDNWKTSSEYDSIAEFYNHTARMCYKTEWRNTNWDEIIFLTKKDKLYLFEIHNQDKNDGKLKDHKDNLHTIYWNALFKDIDNRPKLSGGAEIFYRAGLLPDKQRKRKITTKDGKEKEIIENYRFSKEKFILHISIMLNFGFDKNDTNSKINEFYANNDELYFLGIDRGEKNLEYYSLVDKSGKLIEQGSLNLPFTDEKDNPRMIRVNKHTIIGGAEKIEPMDCWDYNQLLEARAGNRDYARKNWQTIGTIKNLKDGYVSQVVRIIADISTKNGKPTYIVLENLNTGFKRLRQKIEKSVYQKFELALAKKLNFLVDKDAILGEPGSVTNAIQLTPEIKTFANIENKKQVGSMLYVRPDYTSQTDPLTGWRKSIYLKKGSEEFIKEQIIGNKKKGINPAFTEIGFDGRDYCFVYIDKNTGKMWKLYSGYRGRTLDRYRTERNSKGIWVPVAQNVVNILDVVFEKFDKNRSLLEQVKEGKELTKSTETKYTKYTALESLRYAIDMIQQIRNSGTTMRDDDFIISPVRDENGEHFDSRIYWDKEQKKEKAELPSSGDANGAYNIARKGIIMNEHIKRGLNLFIFDEEWDAWLAGREIWEKWLNKNVDRIKR